MRAARRPAGTSLSAGPESEPPRSERALDGLLQIGAGLARIAAEAITGKRQRPPRPGEPPLQQLLRHGTAAAGTVVAMTVIAARDAGFAIAAPPPAHASPREGAPATPAAEPSPPPAPSPPGLPCLPPGETLRIPLSIDNPGAMPMTGLVPTLARIVRRDGAAAGGVTVGFAPASLDIGPRDFEKLVVAVTASKKARAGDYDVHFQLGDAPVALSLRIG